MNDKGFISIIMTLFIMAAMTSTSFGIYAITRHTQKIDYTKNESTQAYYTAEAGIEDAVLRLVTEKNLPNNYSLTIGQSSTTISIVEVSTTTKSVTATGYSNDRYRNLKIAVYNDAGSTANTSFSVGLASGIGGIILENNCEISGNVTANGSVYMENSATIDGNIRVALDTNRIHGAAGATITGDVAVKTCEDVTINGNLECTEPSTCSKSCSGWGGEIPQIPLTITDSHINQWKAEAEAGGTHAGNWERSNGTYYLGPRKIDGNLIIRGTAVVHITGTIWVTGDLEFRQTAQIRLDSSYGTDSGAIVVDGNMLLRNSASARGSGDPNSFMMLVSDKNDTVNTVIEVENSFTTDILSAPNGWVKITQSTGVKHVSAYGVHLRNGATLEYDTNMGFISLVGGGGGTIASSSWSLHNWEEIE